MKIAFLVNDIAEEKPHYTTTRLALAATRRGDETFYVDVCSFLYDPDGHLELQASAAPGPRDPLGDFLGEVQEAERQRIDAQDLDLLMLRQELDVEMTERPWAHTVAIEFGQMIKERGTIVVNDPAGLARATSKLYLESLPPEIRPRTLITRDPAAIKAFVEEQGGRAVIKPLKGSKGENVFFFTPGEMNVNQITETVLESGYAIVQEFIKGAEGGDIRILLVDGEILEIDDRPAAFRRTPGDDDLRSNMSAGAGVEPAEVDDRIRSIVEAIRPRLLADGMFFTGIDVLGDKLVEVNVESPGGIATASAFAGLDFADAVVEALASKSEER